MRLICTFLLCLIGFVSVGQAKIDGIGKMKIGALESELIPELGKEFSAPLGTVLSSSRMFADVKLRTRLFRVLPDTVGIEDRTGLFTVFCPNASMYYVSKYTVANIVLRDVYLLFFNGVLCQLSCKGSNELENAIETKYGKAESSVFAKPVKCFSLAAGNFTKQEKEYTSTWQSEGILTKHISSTSFDTKCMPVFVQILTISDVAISDQAHEIGIKEWNRRRDIQMSAKAKSLKDF